MPLQTSAVSVPRANGKGVMASYLVRPEGAGPFPGLVLIHEIFGLNENIRGIAQRFGLGSKTQPIVNTAILGALAVTTELVTLESVCEAIREEVPQKAEANVSAARAAAEAVLSAAKPEPTHV